MFTIIGNLKGGTGKSTVVFNLATWLRANGLEVSVFDLDPQKTLSDAAEIREEEAYEPNLTVSDDLQQLQEAKAQGAEILVDIGTSDFDTMKQALALADRIVVPVPPSQADIWSTQRFLKLIREVCKKDQLPQVLGFINRADTNRMVRETDEAEEALTLLNGLQHIPIRLYQRTAFRRSFSEGLGVFEMQPSSKASKELRSLAKHLYPEVK